jgi:Flp pilus assembly protein TadG
MIEFAVIVVLLIGLIYGMITIGLVLSVRETITQSAADGAQAGIVQSTVSSATSTATTQALKDLGWFDGSLTCSSTSVDCLNTSGSSCPSSVTVCVNAYQAYCDSTDTTECLTVIVTDNYSQHPLIPNVPGPDVFVPSTISSTATLQMSAATGS